MTQRASFLACTASLHACAPTLAGELAKCLQGALPSKISRCPPIVTTVSACEAALRTAQHTRGLYKTKVAMRPLTAMLRGLL